MHLLGRQSERRGACARLVAKHDAGTVEQPHRLVEHHALHHLGVPRRRGDAADARALERVDQARLAHVGRPKHAHGDRRLEVEAARVVFDELQHRARTHRFGAAADGVAARSRRAGLGVVDRAGALRQMRALRLRRCLEGERGKVVAQVAQPCLDVRLGHQVDLVEDEHHLLACAQQHALRLERPASERIARIQHLEQHVGIVDHLAQLTHVRLDRRVPAPRQRGIELQRRTVHRIDAATLRVERRMRLGIAHRSGPGDLLTQPGSRAWLSPVATVRVRVRVHGGRSSVLSSLVVLLLELLELPRLALVDEAGKLVLVERKAGVGGLLAYAWRGCRRRVRLGGGDLCPFARMAILLSLLSTHCMSRMMGEAK